MNRSGIVALLVLQAGLGLPANAQEVYVTAGEVGQGTLRARLNDCFVITPFHVVESALGPIEVVGARLVKVKGELQVKFEPDFAIIQLENSANLDCEEWLPPTNYDAMLKTQSAGYLSIREIGGTLNRMPVSFRVITEESIIVRPTDPSDQIQKSMSGASLLVNGALVGMLLSRTDEGDGLVYQLDDIMRLSEPYFKVVTPATSAAARNANAFASRFESWFVCVTYYCILPNIAQYAERLREIRIGEEPNKWDRVITLDRKESRTPQANLTIPIRPGVKSVHAQLTFADGTQSEVRTITVQHSEAMSGVRLTASGSRAAQAPEVFAGVAAGANSMAIIPVLPSGTVAVRYAFDAGGFFDADPAAQALVIEAPLGTPVVRLAFQLGDGTELGPFEYPLGKTTSLADESLRALLAASLPGSVACTRVALEAPLVEATDFSSRNLAKKQALDVQLALMGLGVPPIVKEFPTIVCAPPRASSVNWAAAQEIRLGTTPGKHTERIRLTGTTGASPSGAVASTAQNPVPGQWPALFPPTSTAIYMQVVFKNGTSSREFRLPITQLTIPGR